MEPDIVNVLLNIEQAIRENTAATQELDKNLRVNSEIKEVKQYQEELIEKGRATLDAPLAKGE
jgi:hypothetical protein